MKIKAEEPKFGDDEIPAPQNVNYTQGPEQQNTWNQPETNTEPAQPAPAPTEHENTFTPPANPAYTPNEFPASQNVNYTQGPGQQNTWNQPETNTEPAQPAPAPYTPPARPAPAPYTPPARPAPAPYTPPPAPAPSADTPPVQAGIGGGAILIGLLALVGGVYALMDHNTKTAPGGR